MQIYPFTRINCKVCRYILSQEYTVRCADISFHQGYTARCADISFHQGYTSRYTEISFHQGYTYYKVCRYILSPRIYLLQGVQIHISFHQGYTYYKVRRNNYSQRIKIFYPMVHAVSFKLLS